LSVYAPHRPATPAPRHANLFADVNLPQTKSFNEEDVSDKPQYIRQNPTLNSRNLRRIERFYRRRLQSLQAVDESIASLIATLKAQNQLDNTYIFFTSDNGLHLGQHRMPSGKQTPYEPDIHVPLIVRGPGVPTGTRQELMTGNIDFAATFAELAGVKPPDFVDGRSLVPLLGNNTLEDKAWRKVYLLENWQVKGSQNSPKPSRGIQEPSDYDEQLANSLSTSSASAKPRKLRKNKTMNIVPEFQGLRTKNYTYVEYVTGEKELYDLRQDSEQMQNLADNAVPELVQKLALRLNELRQCSRGSCQTVENKPLKLLR
jgi:N-acetylglucosamine-6-sulfatase